MAMSDMGQAILALMVVALFILFVASKMKGQSLLETVKEFIEMVKGA